MWGQSLLRRGPMPLAFQLMKVKGWGCVGVEEEDEVEEEACTFVSLTKGPRLAGRDDDEEEELMLTTGKWRFILAFGG